MTISELQKKLSVTQWKHMGVGGWFQRMYHVRLDLIAPLMVRRHVLIPDGISHVVVEFPDINVLYWMPRYLRRHQILLRKTNHCCTSKGLEKAGRFSQKPSRDCVLLWDYGYRFGTAILMSNSVCMVYTILCDRAWLPKNRSIRYSRYHSVKHTN
jgi:hypothetical protein